MRIGLYGMPTSGKTHILNKLDFIDVIVGSRLLREYDPNFDFRDEAGREQDRKAVARLMMSKDTFIMDGHYAFGDEIAFTEDEGNMYDVFMYLYISPDVLRDRMHRSSKNNKYLNYDLEKWQKNEIESLREYCHQHNKDFYVLDNPPENVFYDVDDVIHFIRDVVNGYSCVSFARKCANDILSKCNSDNVRLFDGDKTLTIEDSSSAVFNYKTHIYDGNFYTGYQAWKQNEEFKDISFEDLTELPVHFNEMIKSKLTDNSYIVTSGHKRVWQFISDYLGLEFYAGVEMSAETKLYIVKFLQEKGKYVEAYGDSMNDYYMLKQADKGYLVAKKKLSRSLKGKDMEGLYIV